MNIQQKINPYISTYINSLEVIYDTSSSFTSIIDEETKVLYLSEAFHKLVSTDSQKLPKSLYEFDQIPVEIIKEADNIHQKIFRTKQSLKYMYIGNDRSGDFMLFRGTKSPVYGPNKKPLGILTIQHRLKVIDIENTNNVDKDFCFDLPDCNLSNVKQLILFYSSFGFTHGEVYQFIVKYHDNKLKYENFKYYWKHILHKFNVSNIKELLTNNDMLKNCRFLPRKLLKNVIVEVG